MADPKKEIQENIKQAEATDNLDPHHKPADGHDHNCDGCLEPPPPKVTPANPYAINPAMFREQRHRLAAALQQTFREPASASSTLSHEATPIDVPHTFACFFEGCSEIPRAHYSDTTFPFRQDGYFQYLFGLDTVPDCQGAVLHDGTGIIFLPRLPESYAVWMTVPDTATVKAATGIDHVYYTDEAAKVLYDEFRVRRLLVMVGDNDDSHLPVKTARFVKQQTPPGGEDGAEDGAAETAKRFTIVDADYAAAKLIELSKASPPKQEVKKKEAEENGDAKNDGDDEDDTGKEDAAAAARLPPPPPPGSIANTHRLPPHEDPTLLYEILSNQRVIKTKHEIALMTWANGISSQAHVAVMKLVAREMAADAAAAAAAVGGDASPAPPASSASSPTTTTPPYLYPHLSQHHLESAFHHHAYSFGGMRQMSYGCICATGASGATLHYPDNDKVIAPGTMALLDMGGEYHCYATDITCSYPVSGKFDEVQRLVYTAVLSAQYGVFHSMRAGVPWVAMHKQALRTMAAHLLRGGLLRTLTAEQLKQWRCTEHGGGGNGNASSSSSPPSSSSSSKEAEEESAAASPCAEGTSDEGASTTPTNNLPDAEAAYVTVSSSSSSTGGGGAPVEPLNLTPDEKATIDAAMEIYLMRLFQPHGLGHLIGLDTHDVGGFPKHRSLVSVGGGGGGRHHHNHNSHIQRHAAPCVRSTDPDTKPLRTTRVLQPGMVITVEPGLYFNKVLLAQAFHNPREAPFLNEDALRQPPYWEFGGVRIEDDVVVNNDGITNITCCPRTIEEIEQVMAGAQGKQQPTEPSQFVKAPEQFHNGK